MLGDQEKTETVLEILDEGSKFREGTALEYLDYVLLKELGIDFTKLPVPRVMGLLRQMRVDAEIAKSKMRGKSIGGAV